MLTVNLSNDTFNDNNHSASIAKNTCPLSAPSNFLTIVVLLC